MNLPVLFINYRLYNNDEEDVLWERGHIMWKFRQKQYWERVVQAGENTWSWSSVFLHVDFSLFPSVSVLFFTLSDWEEEQVSSPNILRLIYQGRFLHGNVTLGGEKTQKVHLLLVDVHPKSQQSVAGKFFAVLIPFLSRRTEVPQCSGQACFDGREGGERKYSKKRPVRKGARPSLE